MNAGKGHEKGHGLTHTETTLDAGVGISLTSGRDTTLNGAQVSGEKITADVGRDLTLQSEQDSDRYDAKQQSLSGGISVPVGVGSGSGYLTASRDKLHSNFDSVNEQTGLFAGDGGYEITVGKHTQLDGAVIASTADKAKNSLDTGTLGWSDIDNRADFSAEHSGGSLSTGGPVGKDLLTNMAGGMLSGANNSGHAQGTTQAAVSDGQLNIRDAEAQQQDIAELNRDVEHANDGSISPIFNKEKEQKRLKEAQLIGELGMQAMDIARTQGEIAALAAQKDPAKLAAARAELESKLKPGDGNITDAAVAQQAYNTAQAEYGTGSNVQKAMQAVTGALTALAGNNLAGALASGASPYLATEIKKRIGEDNVAANAMAHAVLGAITAELNNQSALAGGVGAGGGELTARFIMETLFPGKKPSELSESEKQQVSGLSQLAAGIAGGVASGDIAGAVTGGQAGKNATENNALSAQDDKQRQDAKWSLPYLEGEKKAQAEKLVSDLNAKDKAFDAAMDSACKNLSSAACQGMRQELAAMGRSYDEKLDGQYVGNMGSVYKEGKGQVDALMWQYATVDAKAEREANVNRIAENWGVSKETADGLYTAMAGVHTTAAIGGAVYGMKGLKEPSVSSSQGSNQLINGKWFDAEGLPLPAPPSVGAAGRVPNVLQSGGNTLNKSTANALNESLGESMTSREWGRALEALKKDNGLRNDFHGRILDNGNYVDKSGNVIGNIGDYVP